MRLLTLLMIAFIARPQTGDQGEEFRQFVAKIHTAMGLKTGSVVADVGTGDSVDHPTHITRAIGPAGKLVCEDIDDSALKKLAAKLKEAGMDNVEFVLGEPDNPKLPAHAFDSIIISNAYHEFTDPRPMLDHIRKALKPGGKLVILEAITQKMRNQTRNEQVKVHELAPALLERELASSEKSVGCRYGRIVPGSPARVACEPTAGWLGVGFFRSQLPFEPV